MYDFRSRESFTNIDASFISHRDISIKDNKIFVLYMCAKWLTKIDIHCPYRKRKKKTILTTYLKDRR